MGRSRIVVLDAGHGGMIAGVYQTAGKRSPNWSKGVLYEGVFNRWIICKVCKRLDILNVPYYRLALEDRDVPLFERVARLKRIKQANPNVWLLSQHANAGGGTGFEAFTSKGQDESDRISDKILKTFSNAFPSIAMRYDRTDGDLDKEANFAMLTHGVCPSVLVESLFMDNKIDYELLWSNDFQNKLADCYVEVIKQVYEGNY